MFRFDGDNCQYCKEALTENDDIVVCPHCGSPYHRDCYKQSGSCVRVDLHESGDSYKSEKKVFEQPVKIEVRCPRCGELNDIENDNCTKCGFMLKGQNNPNVSGSFGSFTVVDLYGFDENEELEEGVTAKDVSKYLGQNAGYFISKYKKMKESKGPFSFNFASLFFTYLYLIYRKCFAIGIVFAVILGMLNLPSTFVSLATLNETMDMPQFAFLTNEFVEKMTSISLYTDMIAWAIEILIAIFFNWFYMKSVIKKVKNLKNIYGSDYNDIAPKHGGVLSRKTVFILFAIYFGLLTISQFFVLLFL